MGWGCSYDELRGRECKAAVRFFAPLRPVPILVPPLRQECLQSMIKKVLARVPINPAQRRSFYPAVLVSIFRPPEKPRYHHIFIIPLRKGNKQ